MRITKKTILAIGLIASSLTLNSCDDNDNNVVLQRPTALVKVNRGQVPFIILAESSKINTRGVTEVTRACNRCV